jgi:hypothetical protein
MAALTTPSNGETNSDHVSGVEEPSTGGDDESTNAPIAEASGEATSKTAVVSLVSDIGSETKREWWFVKCVDGPAAGQHFVLAMNPQMMMSSGLTLVWVSPVFPYLGIPEPLPEKVEDNPKEAPDVPKQFPPARGSTIHGVVTQHEFFMESSGLNIYQLEQAKVISS